MKADPKISEISDLLAENRRLRETIKRLEKRNEKLEEKLAETKRAHDIKEADDFMNGIRTNVLARWEAAAKEGK